MMGVWMSIFFDKKTQVFLLTIFYDMVDCVYENKTKEYYQDVRNQCGVAKTLS